MSKGRTLFEILTGRNKTEKLATELQYHNPLKAKIGTTISFEDEPILKNVNFVIEKISVYETVVCGKKFPHTDYHLKGVSLDQDLPLRFRLRLIPDQDEFHELGCRIHLLKVVDQVGWDQDLYNNVDKPEDGEFNIWQDDMGQQLPEPNKYWRVEGVTDSYKARVTILKDDDNDGKVELDELEHSSITYWDYHRDTFDNNEQQFREYLTIEMDNQSKFFTFLRGRDVIPSQVRVI